MKEWGETRLMTVNTLTTIKKRNRRCKSFNPMQLLRYHSLHKWQATIGLKSVVTLYLGLDDNANWLSTGPSLKVFISKLPDFSLFS